MRLIDVDAGSIFRLPTINPKVPVETIFESQPEAVSLGQPVDEGAGSSGNVKLALTIAGIMLSLL